MKIAGQILRGLLVALLSAGVVLGAMSISLAESGAASVQLTVPPTETTAPAVTVLPGTPSATLAPTATNTRVPLLPTATACRKPAGWVYYVIQSGDTLETLARAYNLTVEQITAANCLLAPGLIPGAVLVLPPTRPTASPTVTATTTATQPKNTSTATKPTCGVPPGWVLYTIRSGDTLYALSRAYGVSVNQIMAANCMSGTFLRSGSKIYLPNIPTRTPEPKPTQPAEPSATVTHTPEPTATSVPTGTPTPTATVTETIEPSQTATPTPPADPG